LSDDVAAFFWENESPNTSTKTLFCFVPSE
jgi:hypothetical protein